LQNRKKILVCPLDWGLGHATRCVPIIRELLLQDAEVIVAASNGPFHFLKKEFPNLQFIYFEGYNIRYDKGNSLAFKMFLSIPKIIYHIVREHVSLQKIISENNIDVVISDSRFGLWSKKTKTIFITHQLKIKSPVFQSLLYQINLFFIKKFDQCWVPDLPGVENLSGELSHGFYLPKHVKFIGVLSRFGKKLDLKSFINEFDVFIIISGPEPQRTNFQELILSQLEKSSLKAVVVLGKPSLKAQIICGNSVVYPHLETALFEKYILKSKLVISRSGYSTLMDMAILGKKCIFVPTPGQTEQEYLASFLQEKGLALNIEQAHFSLEYAVEQANNLKPLEITHQPVLLTQIISELFC
jgi:predicted glycosyltransferase